MEKIVCVLAAVAISCVNAMVMPTSQIEVTNRIAEGALATHANFPYVISLQQLAFLPNQTLAHRCGGAMITLQHALTAAQCTYTILPNRTVTLILASQYRVYAGDALLTGDNVAERIRTIANYTVHPEHVIAPANLNDIAILTLTSPYLNTTVVPIPISTFNYIPDEFTYCTVAGWGAQDPTNALASNSLRYASKYVYNEFLCTQIYSTLPGVLNIHPNMLCAASYDIVSVGCYGDEGNALVCNGYLAGILSYTNQCSGSSFPEVFARVSNYTTWITSVTGGASTFTPQLGLFALAAVVLATMFS